ncbi:phosphotransferase family protein [Luminiphilus sp.]|nr:phosphotransferase family protein [Luminiphilus sp.]MDA8659535.1 phosphotransferase family protein [Luminiphilus sp.]MDA9848894.1 phosphotransferase family protein [Luminiphilus sp.]MDB4582756.1 phosphotransferase family protein [Draconibacterium sp.]
MIKTPQDAVCRWLEEQLNWSEVQFLGPLSGGNSNLTWHFSSAEQACVVRTTPNEAISPNSARGIERESKVLKLVEGAVKAPKLIAWCDDLQVMGRPFLVQEWIDGRSVTATLPNSDWDLVGAANALGEDMMRQLADVHSIVWPHEALSTLGRPDNFLNRQLERWLAVRKEHAVRELPLLFELGTWLQDNMPVTECPALIHGDYHLDNTLVSVETPEIKAIIDWELATVGDPAMDVALALLFWGEKRVSETPAFSHLQAISRVSGVVDRRHLAAVWSEETGRSIDTMGYYITLAAWRLAAIVEGAYGLYAQGKVDTPYAAGLEHDVPALLAEAEQAAAGNW